MSSWFKFVYRAYRYRFRYDRAEIGFVRRSLSAGQVAVDVGCHKGAYTYWMRRRVGPDGIVYVFEPQPKQADYLRAAFSAMQYDNVELVPMAASNQVGQLPLYVPAISTQSASLELRCEATPGKTTVSARTGLAEAPKILVDVTTLDQFFTGDRKAPNFIKIDVEGHELAVLEGARRTLERYRPTLLVECEARHHPDRDFRTVFSAVESLGYTGTFFWQGQRLPLARFDAAVHQHLDPNMAKLPRGYANNFAFEFAK